MEDIQIISLNYQKTGKNFVLIDILNIAHVGFEVTGGVTSEQLKNCMIAMKKLHKNDIVVFVVKNSILIKEAVKVIKMLNAKYGPTYLVTTYSNTLNSSDDQFILRFAYMLWNPYELTLTSSKSDKMQVRVENYQIFTKLLGLNDKIFNIEDNTVESVLIYSNDRFKWEFSSYNYCYSNRSHYLVYAGYDIYNFYCDMEKNYKGYMQSSVLYYKKNSNSVTFKDNFKLVFNKLNGKTVPLTEKPEDIENKTREILSAVDTDLVTTQMYLAYYDVLQGSIPKHIVVLNSENSYHYCGYTFGVHCNKFDCKECLVSKNKNLSINEHIYEISLLKSSETHRIFKHDPTGALHIQERKGYQVVNANELKRKNRLIYIGSDDKKETQGKAKKMCN